MLSKHDTKETFYKLTRTEILELKKLRVFNNTTFVYFALKDENPFCNRPVEIKVAEFCLKWGLPESSLYAAIAVLKRTELISICNKIVTIEWAETFTNSSNHCQQAPASRNLESVLDSYNQFSDPRIDTYIDHARPDLLDSLDPPLTPQGEIEGGGEKDLIPGREVVQNTGISVQNLSNELVNKMAIGGGGFAPGGHQGKVVVNASGHSGDVEIAFNGHEGSIEADASGHEGDVSSPLAAGHSGEVSAKASGHTGDVTNNFFPIDLDRVPVSLLEQAKDLGVTFDPEIVAAIKEYHQSQLIGALREMKNYSGKIKHPNKFLLAKLPKIAKENLGCVVPLYSSKWLEAPADPCPENIRSEIWQKLKAHSPKYQSKASS